MSEELVMYSNYISDCLLTEFESCVLLHIQHGMRDEFLLGAVVGLLSALHSCGFISSNQLLVLNDCFYYALSDETDPAFLDRCTLGFWEG